MSSHRLVPGAVCAASVAAGLVFSTPALAASICIDPGHGGSDPGAQGCGLSEAEVNLRVSLALRDLLEANGVTTFMTRTDDVYVGLAERAAYANSKGVDRFASIHSNAGGGTGIETYCMQGSTSASDGWKMAAAIQDEMLSAWPLTDRGVKTANFAVLRDTAMPATLTELAFIDMCSPDAEYLGSDAHRAEAGCAHLLALTGHLGIGGSCGTSPSQRGTAMGAVFEDDGSGDMSLRLAGATATVHETNESVVVGDPEALFSFSLEAGTYTIQASLVGYQPGSVSCTVVANETKWCSIGLRRAEVDAGAATDSGPPKVEAGVTFPEAGELDTGIGSDAADTRPATVYWGDKADGGCACGTTPSRGPISFGSLALLGIALWACRRRRSAHAVVAVSGAFVVLLGCDETGSSVSEATQGQGAAAVLDTAFPSLGSPRRILDGGHTFPLLSPDGRWVAVTHAGFDGLWIASTEGGHLRELSRAARSGYQPRWRDDSGAIAFRDGNVDVPTSFVDRAAHAVPSFTDISSVVAWQTVSDQIMVRAAGETLRVDPGQDKYFAPVVSADGRWVAYTGLSLGIHLYHVHRRATVQLGRGTFPSLSGDGQWLAYEKTDDDGHELIAGDLFLCKLADPSYPVVNLTRTTDVIERTPTLTWDGRAIAWSTADGVFVASLE